MNTSILLRIASAVTFLYFAGHTAGMPWTPVLDTATIPMIETMKKHAVDAMGFSRTYWDFYFGFGIIISVFLFGQALVLWHLGTLAKDNAAKLRPVLAVFAISFIANAVLAWEYFFAVPAALAVAIAFCLGMSFIAAGRSGQK